MASFALTFSFFLVVLTMVKTTRLSNHVVNFGLHHSTGNIAVTQAVEHEHCSKCPSVYLCSSNDYCDLKCLLCFYHDKSSQWNRQRHRSRRLSGALPSATTRKPGKRQHRRRKKLSRKSQQLLGRTRDRLKKRNRRRNLKRRLRKKLNRKGVRPHFAHFLNINEARFTTNNSINMTEFCDMPRKQCSPAERICVLRMSKRICGQATHHDRVCATDGKTYLSRCHFALSRCVASLSEQVTVRKSGECVAGQAEQLLREQVQMSGRRKKKHKRRRHRLRVQKNGRGQNDTRSHHDNVSITMPVPQKA